MSFVGATLAATSVALFVLGVLPRSRVAARLSALGRPGTNLFGRLRGFRVMAPATLRASGLSIAIEQVVAPKTPLALAGARPAAFVPFLFPIGPLSFPRGALVVSFCPRSWVGRRPACAA